MLVVYHNYDPTGGVLNLVLGWIRLICFLVFVWIGLDVGWFLVGLDCWFLVFFKIGFTTGRFWD